MFPHSLVGMIGSSMAPMGMDPIALEVMLLRDEPEREGIGTPIGRERWTAVIMVGERCGGCTDAGRCSGDALDMLDCGECSWCDSRCVPRGLPFPFECPFVAPFKTGLSRLSLDEESDVERKKK